ncbi:MAG: DUF4405 domain-containing protein [Candidatus Limimorpha sp.]
MKKKQLLVCNNSELMLSPVVLASGIVLECLHGSPFLGLGNAFWVWLHIAASSVLAALVVWHIYLNWRGVNHWRERFNKHRSKGFKAMFVFFMLAIVTGLVAIPLWLSHGHIGIGGVHGKIGFIAAFFVLLHIVRHRRWYSGR